MRKSFDPIACDFFGEPTLQVARNLLGTLLCRRFADGSLAAAQIVEVEAYTEDDPACHAFKGLTERCRVMFGPPGYSYVYFIYGMYHCLNVVTEREGTPGAVLIRAIDMPGGEGPGKLCRMWGIDKSHNGINLINGQSELFLAEGVEVPDCDVMETPRIGITVGVDRIWRFIIKGNPHVSGPSKVMRRPGRTKTRV